MAETLFGNNQVERDVALSKLSDVEMRVISRLMLEEIAVRSSKGSKFGVLATRLLKNWNEDERTQPPPPVDPATDPFR